MTKYRERKTVTILGEKGSVKTESIHLLNLLVAMPKKLIPQIFSPGNLNLEREKRALTTFTPTGPTYRNLGCWCHKNSYILPVFCFVLVWFFGQGPGNSLSAAMLTASSFKPEKNQEVGGKLPLRFFWLV